MFECQADTAEGARFDCEEEVVDGKFAYGPPTCTETGESNVQAQHVYPHTARGRVEAALANGRHVDRVSCAKRRARRYVCRLIFSDQPDNTATVDVLRNGDLLVGEDTGTTAYPQTKTLSQP
jgi:hypothetical protein